MLQRISRVRGKIDGRENRPKSHHGLVPHDDIISGVIQRMAM
jgi:hypothetical protein